VKVANELTHKSSQLLYYYYNLLLYLLQI